MPAWQHGALGEINRQEAGGHNLTPNEKAAITLAYRSYGMGQPLPAPNESLQTMQAKAAPDNSALANLGGGVGTTLGNATIGVVGAVAPETGLKLRQQRDAAYATSPDSISGYVGHLIGGSTDSTPAMFGGPAGLAYSAVGAGGNARIDVADRRQQGETIGRGAEAANAVGSAALDYATNYVSSKVLGGVGATIAKKFGAELATHLATGDVAAATQTLIKAGIATVGKEQFGQAGIAAARQTAENAVAKFTYDPTRNVFSNVPQAGRDGFIQGTLLSPLAALHAHNEITKTGNDLAGTANSTLPAPSESLARSVGVDAGETEPDLSKGTFEVGPTEGDQATTDRINKIDELDKIVPTQAKPGVSPPSVRPLVENAAPKFRVTDGETSRGVPLDFENPDEKALFLATQPRQGKVSIEATAYLTDRGWSADDVVSAGKELRGRIADQADGFTGDTLTIKEPEPTFEAPTGGEDEATSARIREANVAEETPQRRVSDTTPPAENPDEVARIKAAILGTDRENPSYGRRASDTYSARDMFNLIKVKNTGEMDEGATKSLLGQHEYALKDVPIGDVGPARGEAGINPALVSEYAKQSADSAPPIVLGDDGRPIDGKHRVAAARLRGDKTVKAYVPTSESTPAPSPIETPVEQKPTTTLSKIGERAKAFASDERGSAAPGAVAKAIYNSGEAFANQDVLPAMKRGIAGVTHLVKSAERFLGKGAITSDTLPLQDDLRRSWAQQDLERIRTEELFKPALAHAAKYSEAANTQAIEAIEAGQPQPDPVMQPYADMLRSLAARNMKDAKAEGINTDKWDSNQDWVGRVFEWPDKAGGSGTFSSVAGNENYLKGRVFDNYADALAAVKAAGGKPKYDNFIETSLAKQVEIRKSIEARRIFNQLEANGGLVKVKPGDTPPDGWKYLDDKLSKKLGGGQRYAAPEHTANLLNDIIAPGLNQALPVWKQWAGINHAITAVNLGLSGAHALNMATGGMALNIAQAGDNLLHGEFKLATKNIVRAATAPITTALLGSKIREQARTATSSPELEPLVQTNALSGRFGFKSVLDSTALDRAKEAYDQGNYVGAAGRLAKAAWEGISYPLFRQYIPNVKAGVLGIRAETELARQGPTPDVADITRKMAKHSDLTDNILGEVVQANKFQHKIVSDAAQGIFLAPNWNEGLVRFLGGAARDYVKAGASALRGQMPEVTPNMLMPVGAVLAHMAAGAAIHMALNGGQPPQTLRDYFQPKSGQKDEDGNDIRLSLLTPFKDIPNLMSHPARAVWNKLSPLIHIAHDIAVNSDYRGVKIWNDDDTVGTNLKNEAKFAAKSLLPFSVESYQRMSDAGAPGVKKALGFAGLNPVPRQYDQSPALSKAYELMDAQRPVGTRTEAEYDRHQLVGRLAQSMTNPRTAAAARGELRDNYRSGILTQSDVEQIKNRVKTPDPLVRAVKRLGLDGGMQVWGEANDAEKRAIAPALFLKVRNDKSMPREDRVKYLKTLQQDWTRLHLPTPTTEEADDAVKPE